MFKLKRNQIIITALVVMIAVAGYLNYLDSRTPKTADGVTLTDQGEVAALVPDTLDLIQDTSSTDVTANDTSGTDVTASSTDTTAAGAAGADVTATDTSGTDIGDALAFDDNPQIDTTMTQTDGTTDTAAADASGTDISTASATADGSTDSTDSTDSTMTSGTDASADSGGGTDTDSNPGTAVFVNTTSDSSYFVQAKLDREQARSKEEALLTDIINNANVDQDQKATAAQDMLDIQKRIEKETAAEAMIEAKGFSDVYVRIDDTGVDVVVSKAALTDAEIAQIEDIVKRKTGMTEDQIHISPMRQP